MLFIITSFRVRRAQNDTNFSFFQCIFNCFQCFFSFFQGFLVCAVFFRVFFSFFRSSGFFHFIHFFQSFSGFAGFLFFYFFNVGVHWSSPVFSGNGLKWKPIILWNCMFGKFWSSRCLGKNGQGSFVRL